MAMRSCVVVLIGETTATRKWVKYEIKKAYELNKGIVGIYVHNLDDMFGNQTNKGSNPFYSIFANNGERLSKYVQCFDSEYKSSKYVYNDIADILMKHTIFRLILKNLNIDCCLAKNKK